MHKIIVIDDDDSLREAIVELLELNEYEVISYCNGVKGLEGILEHKPDLVVCDVMMPEIDGYGVINKVRNRDEIKYTPFIFLTAKIENKDFRRGMNLGADDYLTKPFEVDELLKIIKSRIQKHQNLLKESEFKFRTLFEQSTDGILICDADGNISDVNFGLTGMLGYSRDELLTMKMNELKVSDEIIFNETIKNLKDYGKLIKAEMTIKDSSGDIIPVECTVKRIYGDKIQVIVRDVTLFKKTENELISEKNKSEKLSKLKSAAISYIRSEVIPPLNALVGYTDMIAEKTKIENLTNEIKQVIIGGNRLLRNMNSIMKLTQFESNNINIEISKFDICKTMNELYRRFEILASFKKINLHLHCEGNNLMISSDKEIVKLIILNLIDNAVKFTHQGSININVFKKPDDNNKLIISVIDTGTGIKKEDMKSLIRELDEIIDCFENNGRKGMGLSLVFKLAEYIGGNITVKSEYGKGSDFSLTIPISL